MGFFFAAPALLHAQSNPPFKNPALDSDCYFPQIGDPSEMDTLYGSVGNQALGQLVKNLGTKYNGGYGNMFIENLTPSSDPNINTLSQVTTGTTFNLHQMTQYLQKINPDDGGINLQGNGLAGGFTLGHFRDQAHLDIYSNWKIFWADDNGNYDSLHFTSLKPNIPPGNFGIAYGGDDAVIGTYIAHLTTDTLDDIITSCYSEYTNDHDTAYALLFRGKNTLFDKDTVFEDTSVMLYPMKPNGAAFRAATQADFRGVGREDLIVSDESDNLCYYKNDPPFSISQFAQGVAKDTIFAIWQNPQISVDGAIRTWFTMRALPKESGDNSVDFMPDFDTVNAKGNVSNGSLYIFRGGPDFGSHRITLDSAAFVIHAPATVDDGTPFWGGFADAGDMTGTGNRVLYTGGTDGVSIDWDNFFVTGKALDDKIDIYNIWSSGGAGDTLTANDDSLEDFLMGEPGSINPQGTLSTGDLRLTYGSKQIPVRLNPLWADVKNIPTQDGIAFTLSPNPTQLWSVATIVWPEAEEAEYEVYNIFR